MADEEKVPDWAGLEVYRSANTALLGRPIERDRIVFFGDSITEMWALDKAFAGKSYVNRGIGGQTTPQMLVRFRQDVVDLKPKLVVILAGTNDVAENLGPTTLAAIEGNLASMFEIAEANHIRVILCSILPVSTYPWRKHIQPVEKITALNAWIKGYAQSHGVVYLDYYSRMQNENHGMKADLSDDGVHPNAAGFAMMQKLVAPVIAEILGQK
jgi:lysophospholipase L1-like esterase